MILFEKKLLYLKKQLLLIVVVIGFISSAAYGAIFYVASSGCNNSYPGTETQPWCTISTSIRKLSAGDTLYIKNGTYNEELYITGPSGSAENRTIISAYPGHAPVLRGNGVNGGRNKILNASYLIFSGFTITNYNQGLFVEGSNHIILDHLTIYSVGQEAVHIKLNSSYVTAQNNLIHDTRAWQYNGEGFYIGTAQVGDPQDNSNNIIIKNNTIYNTNDEAIEFKSGTHDCIADNNIIYDALLDAAYNNNTGVGMIEVDPANDGYNPQSWGSNPNHIVRNNTIFGIRAKVRTAINLNTGATAYNNVIYGMTDSFPGINISRAQTETYSRNVYHNTIDLPSSRAVVISGGATTDVRNNIGPTTTGNVATSDVYYFNKAGNDYHLVNGSAPINIGANLTSIVPVDRDGISRTTGAGPDLGAYEYSSGTPAKMPNPPSNIQVY